MSMWWMLEMSSQSAVVGLVLGHGLIVVDIANLGLTLSYRPKPKRVDFGGVLASTQFLDR